MMKLYEQYGPMIGGPDLVKVLGFRSNAAFRRAERLGLLGVRIFGYPYFRVPEPIRIDARDPSYAYDVLQDLTENGKLRAYILPFGPKPHSLAMALHSIKSGSEMMYTQPKVYHPDYSIGIKQIRGGT